MYQLDTQAAREADNHSAYLSETGKYVGKFTRAEKLISRGKGTHGIGFTFADESNRTTRFDLWTINAQNEQLQGYKALQAIMTVLKLRGLEVKPGKVERYNYEAKQTDVVDAETFPALVGVPIGLVLRSTEYEKMQNGQKTGQTGWRLELVAPFDAKGEFTASEILDRKTEPQKLAALISTLADRPLKQRPQSAQRSDGYDGPPAGHPANGGGIGFDDMDSDIPF